MTAEFLTILAAAFLSLLFSYAPGLSGWYEGLDGTYKRLVMLGALALTTAAVVGASCANLSLFSVNATCDQAGFTGAIQAFIMALAANQGTYKLTNFSESKPPAPEPNP